MTDQHPERTQEERKPVKPLSPELIKANERAARRLRIHLEVIELQLQLKNMPPRAWSERRALEEKLQERLRARHAVEMELPK